MTPAALADLVHAVAVDVLTERGLDAAVLPDRVVLERPRDPGHGDYATTLALRSARDAGVAPSDLAGWLAARLRASDAIAAADVAGAGFVNLRLADSARTAMVAAVLALPEADGPADTAIRAAVPPDAAALADVRAAHAELAAVARWAADLGVPTDDPDPALLTADEEVDVARVLGEYPAVLTRAADRREPHRVARHLDELVGACHRMLDAGRVLPRGDEEPTPRHTARLALCAAARRALAHGLGLLGVSAPARL